jgi:hypothetical protein
MRKPSKPAILITAAVLAAALIASVAVGTLWKNSGKTKISQLDISKKQSAKKTPGPASRNENDVLLNDRKHDDTTIGDAIKKEQQMLKESEKGGYVGRVAPSVKKKDVPDLDGMILPESEDAPIGPEKRHSARPDIYNDPGAGRGLDGDAEQSRKKTWEYMYARKATGGFMHTAQPATVNTASTVAATSRDPAGNEKNSTFVGQAPKVQYFRPYRAVIDRTFTSADERSIFVATGNEVPLKGWKILGKANANFNDNRFHVEVSGILSSDNVHYPAKGYVASIDQSDGIISKVRHDDIGGTVTSSILAGMSSFLGALRKDTTTVEVTSGTTVTGQQKDDNRVREAGLASGDTMFQGMAKKAESAAKKTPTLIMEKGVPVLVYFAP